MIKYKRRNKMSNSKSPVSNFSVNPLDQGSMASNYKPIGNVVSREVIAIWARMLGVAEGKCAKLAFLFFLPKNFKGYSSGYFCYIAHASHLWYCNIARILGWYDMRHKFSIAKLAGGLARSDGKFAATIVGSDIGVTQGMGRGDG
jgi:hypothetical protein